MRALLLDYPGSKLQQPTYAIAMRMAYLLCNQVVYAGQAAELYGIVYKGSSLSTIQKVEAMKYGEVDKADQERFLATAKMKQQWKHQHKTSLAISSKFNRIVDSLFELELEDIQESFYSKSFMRAEGVCGQPGIFKRLLVNKNPERSEKNIPAYSDWLLLNLEETEGDIIVLPAEFFQCLEFEETTDDQPGEEEQFTIHIDHCISLPLLGYSTMEEMECIRNYAANELAAFKKSMNQYIDLFVDNEDNINTLEFFTQQVKPTTEALNKKWREFPLMADLGRRCKGNMELQVWMGEVPVEMIWDFYNEMDAIPPATWKRLQEAATEDERLQGSWPVIIVHIKGDEEIGYSNNTKKPALEKRRTIKL
jgi:hypothetical protein